MFKAAWPDLVNYVFATENEDTETHDTIRNLCNLPEWPLPTVVAGDFKGSAPAWDAAAKVSRGHILVQMQDDLVLPEGWDKILRDLAAPHASAPCAIAVADGYRKDNLLCTAIINRARYEQQGEFLHAGYQSVFSDDEFSVRAYRDVEEGRCTLVDARDLVTFRHDNVYHIKGVPDATALRQNSPEAYESGMRLFIARNPWYRKYRTWG
jgi:hypothetical protein